RSPAHTGGSGYAASSSMCPQDFKTAARIDAPPGDGPFAAILRSCRGADKLAPLRLVYNYLMRKDEGCGAVLKLHEVHDPIQVAHLAQDSWPFIEARKSLAVANRL